MCIVHSVNVLVAVPVPFVPLLTYGVPHEALPPVRGARVLVPLGARQVTGCVVDTRAEAPDEVDVKPLTRVLDTEPFLPNHVVDLALWAAEYYAAGPGEALAAAMPPHAWMASERRYAITDAGRGELTTGRVRGAQAAVLRALADSRSFTARELSASPEVGSNINASLRVLLREGFIAAHHAMRGRAAAFRTIRVAALTAAGEEVASGLRGDAGSADASGVTASLGEKQLEVLRILRGSPSGLAVSALKERGAGTDTIARLVRRGLVAARNERQGRDPFRDWASFGAAGTGSASPGPGSRELTPEQADAFRRLRARLARSAFHVALLHGVTGSGKTELYLRLAAETCAAGRTVLVLVPEIALTPVVAAIFRDAFGSRVAIQHSGLSAGERHDEWHRTRDGQVDIVVGTRSAVFAPLDRVGLVIVDEEHDPSYKQEETPRYNGRDLAIVRARAAQALVVLGSATPSMESYRNALEGRYELVRLERRVLDRPLADVRIINMREVLAEEGPEVILSAVLVRALQDRLERRQQTLLLLNRRGFSTAVFCRQCGATLDCPNCSISLTIHRLRQASPRARCHYCNYSQAVPKACTLCAAPYLEHVGFGTEQVEAEVRRLVPAARVARVDRDSMRRRGAIHSVLASFGRGEIDVIVGTQMIAKGHDFPAVTLVGVISADVGLGLPDFRASERTFQLLTQVAGRAGRGDAAGQAIVQTLFPEHFSIQLACRQDYAGFYSKEIGYRRAMRYPPIVSLINAIVRGRSFGRAMEDATDLAARVRAHQNARRFRVLGPAPAPLGRLRGEYRAQILVKGSHRAVMRDALSQAVTATPDLQRRVTIDVDPLSMM